MADLYMMALESERKALWATCRLKSLLAPILAPMLAAALAACTPGGEEADHGDAKVPGDSGSTRPYDGVGIGETLRFTGNEPFWGGQVTGTTLTYSTPDNPAGQTVTAVGFAGRNGLSYSGMLDGADFVMAVTPGQCSDGMSDRTYPFTVTLQFPAETRHGCAWSERQPFTGPQNP